MPLGVEGVPGLARPATKSGSCEDRSVRTYKVQVRAGNDAPKREEELAWRLAEVATGGADLDGDVAAMVANRVIDDAAVALAALTRRPVATARAQALAHPREGGSTLFGLPADVRVHAEWAAWANGVAVRELDFHDTFLAADFAHPGDNIPPLLAVAQQRGRDGQALARAIAAAYEEIGRAHV